jgi:oxygen-independent coproporphyrinogen-3 oxidase
MTRASDAPTDSAEEHFFVGLRLDAGISPSAEEWDRFARPISKWLNAGMLKREDARLRLSEGGVLVSNEIFEDFLNV